MKSTKAFLYLSLFLISTGMMSCSDDDEFVLDSDLRAQLLKVSINNQGTAYFELPASTAYSQIPQDPKNPITEDKVKLGQMLFHETGLAISPTVSGMAGTYSCASCHHAGAGFQAGIKQGIGEGGVGFGVSGESRVHDSNRATDDFDVQPVRSPSAMNGAYQKVMLWNGQFGATGPNTGTEANWPANTPIANNHLGYEGLETQAIAGLTVHRMDSDTAQLFADGYKEMFDNAFPDINASERYTLEYMGLAIAAYERTVMANEAPFQQWLKGEYSAMTDDEKRGAILFFGKAECYTCHSGPALNSMEFHALGMNDFSGTDVQGVTAMQIADAGKGRGSFTKNSADDYKFKVPQLYNLKDSPFYGHGGSFQSVEAVVKYKNNAIKEKSTVPNGQLAAGFQPLNLTDDEVSQLVKFIEISLYDANLDRYVPTALPSGNCFPNADAQSKIDLDCN